MFFVLFYFLNKNSVENLLFINKNTPNKWLENKLIRIVMWWYEVDYYFLSVSFTYIVWFVTRYWTTARTAGQLLRASSSSVCGLLDYSFGCRRRRVYVVVVDYFIIANVGVCVGWFTYWTCGSRWSCCSNRKWKEQNFNLN